LTFDVCAVRVMYPALADGHAYLDGAAGTQVPVPVIEAIAAAYRGGSGTWVVPSKPAAVANPSSRRPGPRSPTWSAEAPTGSSSGRARPRSRNRFADALSRQWTPDDEIVVSRLDHDSNIRPWIQAAGRIGAIVRWAEADLATGELPAAQYGRPVGPRTRLVAVTAASNAIGTRPDVAAIAASAHAVGALCYVDGVHATPHVPVDIAALRKQNARRNVFAISARILLVMLWAGAAAHAGIKRRCLSWMLIALSQYKARFPIPAAGLVLSNRP